MSFTDKLLSKINSSDSFKLSDKDYFHEQCVWVPTGSPELESNIGVLGFPVGLTEISGLSRSGKTTLALSGMKWFQRQYPDGVCIILSSEERDNRDYARKIGVAVDRVIVIRSKFLEDLFYKFQIHLDEIYSLWKKEGLPGKPKLYVMWDSVGATNSRAELATFKKNVEIFKKNMKNAAAEEEGEEEEDGDKKEEKLKHAAMADFARVGNSHMKAILAQIYDNDIVFIMLNHRQDKMDGTGQTSSKGGKWIEFLPTLRLETKFIGHEKIDDVEVAQKTIVRVEKNDFGGRKKTTIEILLGYGIVLSKEDIEYGVKKGIIKKETATVRSFLSGKVKWSSKRTLYELYKNKTTSKFMDVLTSKIMQERHKDVLAEKDSYNED